MGSPGAAAGCERPGEVVAVNWRSLATDPPPLGELVIGLEIDDDNGDGAYCLGELDIVGEFHVWTSRDLPGVEPTHWHSLPDGPPPKQGDLL